MDKHIITELKDGILRIEIDRSEKKNALTLSMKDAISEAIWRGEQDPKVRVIVIHGQKDFFTAGADISSFSKRHPKKNTPWPDHLTMFRSAKKILISAISGYAIGAGTTLLFHCDLVYAAENARFRLPFTNLGLCPENGSSLLLPKIVGFHRASELLLLGDFFDANKAYELGLVNAIFPTEQLLPEVLKIAKKIAQKPPKSLQVTKYLIKKHMKSLVEDAIDVENRNFYERTQSAEHAEATAAFFEKRKPDFSKLTE
ncbi:MAG: enoyl-CoA hydratase [Promethearchaeota archaeon]